MANVNNDIFVDVAADCRVIVITVNGLPCGRALYKTSLLVKLIMQSMLGKPRNNHLLGPTR